MRKIIESTLVSLDGVIGDPMVWASDYFAGDAQDDALAQLMASDAMLMGRRTYEAFAAMWPGVPGAYADRMNNIQKYVFSSTLDRAEWNNSTVISADVAVAAAKLKQEDGQDLVMYGHGPLGQTLLERHLLDELRFAIHPLFVGRSTPLFREGEKATLRLVETKALGTGVVVLSYLPADS